ncbi:MAG: hypothetical protein U9N61_02415 [Euryarchaeota archaeon]|nr:hypothetical protein [Euryarchaeota archaeon]
MNSILETPIMERYTKLSESCTDFRATSCILCLCLPRSAGEEIMTKSIEMSGD